MSEDPLDPDTARQIVVVIKTLLERGLADPAARAVILTRDEALLTLGLVGTLAELVENEQRKVSRDT